MNALERERAGMFDLGGRVVVITGAGFGLGREFALGVASFGATVVCADVDPARAAAVVQEIESGGGRGLALEIDVASEASVEQAFASLVRSHPRIDALFNNAGIATVPARVHELAVADWDRLFTINLRGAFLCTRAVLPKMMTASKGSIVNIASIHGLIGYYPGFPAAAANYNASKSGLIGFTRQIAVEYAADGIRANAIAPGYHGGTDLGRERRSTMTPDDIARFEGAIRAGIPMGRRGVPAELRGLAIYLASDASSYVTGQVFAHDGGWTAQ